MDESTARDLLRGERAATLRRVQTLAGSLSDIVSNTDGANSDDEHDPEGSTIAFERAQIAALLAEARAYLGELDQAMERLRAGSYSVCERCGGQIGADRLEARPAARTCILCAGSPG